MTIAENRRWEPNQWCSGENDLYPELPPSSAVVDMIEENFFFNLRRNPYVAFNGDPLCCYTFSDVVVIFAYCSLRRLTVAETMGYFGKGGRRKCDQGENHPVRTVEALINAGKGNEPVSDYLVFDSDQFPLIPKAA